MGLFELAGGLVLAAVQPDCVSVVAGLGTALVATTLWLLGAIIGHLLRALRLKLGLPDGRRGRGPRLPGQSVQDIAARLRHDSPGGWTAGETRWTFAHEHGWFNSPDYRIFVTVVLIAGVAWTVGMAFAHRLCP